MAQRQAPPIPPRVHPLALAASPRRRADVLLRADDGGARDDRAAVHAVHHRPRPAEHRPRPGRADEQPASGRLAVRRAGDPDAARQRVQELPPTAVEHARHALAAAIVVRSAPAPAAAQTVGHEDRRDSLAHHRRRGHDDRAAADGGPVAFGVNHSAHHRGGHPDELELAAGADRARHHSRRHADQFYVGAPRAADLSVAAQGRGADRWPCRRNLFGDPGRACVRPRAPRARRIHARPAHGPAQGALRAAARDGPVDVLGAAPRRGQRRDRLVRRLSQSHGPRVDRRHHGVPVVHVPSPQSGLEHRQLVLRAAAVARGDGARVRSAGDGGRQTRPARCARRATGRSRSAVRRRRVRVPRRSSGRAGLQRHGAGGIRNRAGRPERCRQDDGNRSRGAVSRSRRADGFS